MAAHHFLGDLLFCSNPQVIRVLEFLKSFSNELRKFPRGSQQMSPCCWFSKMSHDHFFRFSQPGGWDWNVDQFISHFGGKGSHWGRSYVEEESIMYLHVQIMASGFQEESSMGTFPTYTTKREVVSWKILSDRTNRSVCNFTFFLTN